MIYFPRGPQGLSGQAFNFAPPHSSPQEELHQKRLKNRQNLDEQMALQLGGEYQAAQVLGLLKITVYIIPYTYLSISIHVFWLTLFSKLHVWFFESMQVAAYRSVFHSVPIMQHFGIKRDSSESLH